MSGGLFRHERAGVPWLFGEFVLVADLLRDGEPVFEIAQRLQRRTDEIRAIVPEGPYARAGKPWLLAEFVAIASWLRRGKPYWEIALRLGRRSREVRKVVPRAFR